MPVSHWLKLNWGQLLKRIPILIKIQKHRYCSFVKSFQVTVVSLTTMTTSGQPVRTYFEIAPAYLWLNRASSTLGFYIHGLFYSDTIVKWSNFKLAAFLKPYLTKKRTNLSLDYFHSPAPALTTAICNRPLHKRSIIFLLLLSYYKTIYQLIQLKVVSRLYHTWANQVFWS